MGDIVIERCTDVEKKWAHLVHFRIMHDHMENFLEDRSYYFTLHEDARLLRRSAEVRGDVQVMAMLDSFLVRLRAIGDLTLAYWRHGQSGDRTDIAWAMGFGDDGEDSVADDSVVSDHNALDSLDSFLADFGLTDHDLHHKSLSDLVRADGVIGALARHIETSRENYLVFLNSAKIVG